MLVAKAGMIALIGFGVLVLNTACATSDGLYPAGTTTSAVPGDLLQDRETINDRETTNR